ncbi:MULTISPECIES: hypothetical protein [Paracidovorax]|uniref:hypothetical protein n=1 Tax=Paracidovorax TaxID=3051137 RepID=UPI0009D9D1E0|nr:MULTISPECIES: hypothetical protein [Paracidovorax]QCX11270.1 hypothetical protein APS58_2451 [Paracidovorax citrulli]UEG45759.1 hypothetical protein LKW27_19260 [Paracidovorax citrulli]UMT94982.1 hypothetical protein FRC97_08180 [Paracidovorax citrulli]
MNAVELIGFLGHASIYKPFDDYLAASGIKKRPKIGKSLDTIIPLKGTGLTISFDIDAEGEGIVPKSEGTFIFYQLEIMMLDKGQDVGVYAGPLPYGLLSTDSRSEIESKLKNLKRRLPTNDSYFVDGLVWTVVFQEERLRYFQVGVPTDGKRKHGLCD